MFLVAVYGLVGIAVAALAGWAILTFLVQPGKLGAAAAAAVRDTDCVYGAWTPWMGCEAGTPSECGNGVGVRFRGIQTEAVGAGRQCDAGLMTEEEACRTLNAGACAAGACSYSDWSVWSPPCPATACVTDTGNACVPPLTQARSRSIVHEASQGGLACDPLTLIEYQQCPALGACGPPVDCVPEPWSDVWSGCPADACVPAGAPPAPPPFQYQTRGVAVPASGGGQDCQPSDFVRSATCPPLPPCTGGCAVTAWGPWSPCDAPCSSAGPGAPPASQWRAATAVDNPDNAWCDATQVRACPAWPACPLGAFQTVAASRGTARLASPVPAQGASLLEILALCAETPSCAGVTSASDGVFMLSDASPAAREADAASTVFAWDATSAACVPPTWPMLDAECLGLCAGGALPARGRVYAFALSQSTDGAPPQAILSCPITPELMQTPGVAACAPATSGGAWTCARSVDCAYEPWADAKPWSACSAPCGAGGGTRTRRRDATPPVFLGAPCVPEELEAEVACNVPGAPGAWSAAPQMTCLGTQVQVTPAKSNPTADTCAAAAAAGSYEGFSFAAADSLNEATTVWGNEIFYAGWTAGAPPPGSDARDSIAAVAAKLGFTWRSANLDEVAVAAANGAQWCEPGFLAGTAAAAWPMQETLAGCGSAGVNGARDAAGGVFVGVKPLETQATTSFAAAGVTVLPFVTSHSGGQLAAVWDAPGGHNPYLNACLGHGALDAALAAGTCAAAGAAASLAADFACAPATDCSLSDWVDYSACPACGPPYVKWQTREYVAEPTNGGTPCYAFSTQRSVTCDPAPPGCAALAGATVFGPWPSTQAAGAAPCAGAGGVTGTAYTNAWDAAVQAAWILGGGYDTLNAYNSSTASALPQALADALNAQCLGAGGAPPTCIAPPGGGPTFALTPAPSGVGWTQTPCTPDAAFSACLSARGAGGANTRLVYDLGAQQWACPSTCPYDPSACAYSPCSAPCAGFPGTAQMTRAVLQVGSTYDPVQRLRTEPCVGASTLPTCTGACPLAPNTLQCGGPAHGTCIVETGACSCTDGYGGPACWYGCPMDAYGRVCSGAGTCNADGICECAAGATGVACEVPPYSFLGVFANAQALRACDTEFADSYCEGNEADGYISGFPNVGYVSAPPDSCVDYADAIASSFSISASMPGLGIPSGEWWMQRYMPIFSSLTCAAQGFTQLQTDAPFQLKRYTRPT